MRPLIAIFSFLVLEVPLLVHTQIRESNVNSTGVLFQNGMLPVSCNVHIGVDWRDGDMILRPIPDVDNPGVCCAMCSGQSGCRAWLWRSDYDHCWLKHTVTSPRPCPQCVGGIFHDVIPEVCERRDRVEWSGANLEVRIGTTVGDCCDACRQRQNCTGWTFRNTQSPRCFLKESNERETNCTNCISGVNVERNRTIEDRCNVERGVDWYGNDINGNHPFTNTTAAGCCELCYYWPSCRAWMYQAWWNRCYLKYHVTSGAACPECIGGIVRE